MTVKSQRSSIERSYGSRTAPQAPTGTGGQGGTTRTPVADSGANGDAQTPTPEPVLPPGWYGGGWQILPGVESLESHPHLRPGEIVRHRTGAIILTCPACHAMQFALAKVSGTDERPTLDRPVHCGAGHCRRCGIWFTITDGVAALAAPPTQATTEVPARLARAGVHRAPRQPV